MQDAGRAAELMAIASRSPKAPVWFIDFAASLFSKAGRRNLGQAVLREYLERTPEGYGADRARAKLKELEQ